MNKTDLNIIEEQLAIMEPIPEREEIGQYRNNPLRIGEDFRQINLIPQAFWDEIEIECQNSNIHIADMDILLKIFLTSFAKQKKSLRNGN